MKVLITGAHFTPAVSLIEELKKTKGVEIVYVGRKYTMEGQQVTSVESQLLPKLGVEFIPIITGRLQRSFTIFTIPSLLKIPVGFIHALLIILSQKPDVVVSFGGYVAVPVVFAAWLLSIPVLVHEQTLVSGLANKISAVFADKIAIGFPQNEFAKNPKAVLTGNPLRKEISSPKDIAGDYKKLFQLAKKEDKPVVFMTGGNQGSHAINEAVEGCLEKLLKKTYVIHQTGDSNFKDYERLMSIQDTRYIVEKFIAEEMGTILSQADLVVSRAGINTLTECAYLHKPVLVIPLPHLYQNEQVKNAKFFEKLGLVKILNQSDLSSDSLYHSIENMLESLSKWQKQAREMDLKIEETVAKKIALEVISLAPLP